MSRIGKLPIQIPTGVIITVDSDDISVKGPKGELTVPHLSDVTVKLVENEAIVSRHDDERIAKAQHGLQRALLNNAVVGVAPEANIYAVKYGVQVGVIRNVPFAQRPIPVIGVLPQGFTDGPVIMYQGAVNVGRGLEEVIRAMPMMPDCRFLIAGDGDIRKLLENLVNCVLLAKRFR